MKLIFKFLNNTKLSTLPTLCIAEKLDHTHELDVDYIPWKSHLTSGEKTSASS